MNAILKKLFFFLFFFCLFASALFSAASYDEIRKAAEAISKDFQNATDWQKALAFENNRVINQMAYSGALDMEIYKANQKWFSEMNLQLARNAGDKMGFTIKVQENPTGKVKPGTDSDYHVYKGTRDLTLYEMKQLRDLYNKEVEKFFRKSNYQFAQGTEWAHKTNTDFMAPVNQTKEFVRISDWINNDMRGAAYRSPEASIVEAMIRSGNTYFSPQFASAYSTEMNYQLGRMDRVMGEVDRTMSQLSSIRNPSIAQREALSGLTAMQEMNDALKAKYLQRKYDINKIISERYNIPLGFKPDEDILHAASSRTPDIPQSKILRPDGTLPTSSTARQAKWFSENAQTYARELDRDLERMLKLGPQGKIAQINFKLAELQFNAEQRAAEIWRKIDTSAPYRYMADKLNTAYQNMLNRASGWGARIQQMPAYQNIANYASRWGKPIANVLNNVDNGTWRRFTNSKIGYQDAAAGSRADRMAKWMQNSGLKYGGWILTFLVYYDIAKEAYATGEYKQGLVNALAATAILIGVGKVLSLVLTPLAVANPITATALATLAMSYLLTREFMSRVEYNGKTLDEHTQQYIDDQFFQSDQYDVEAEGNIMKLYTDAIKKGHKLKDGMTVREGWLKIRENIKKGGKIFVGIFAEQGIPDKPPVDRYGPTTVINSTIKNEVSGTAVAKGNSEINTGVSARGSYIKDSNIENKGNVNVEAKDKSKVNTGVSLDNANVQGATIAVQTQGKIEASGGSNVNAGVDANNSRIRESEIRSTSSVNISAMDKSTINTGVKAGTVEIKNSKLTNSASGTAEAGKGSAINMGLKFEKSNDEPELGNFK